VATSPNYLASSDVLKHFASKVSVIPIGLDHAQYPIPSANRLGYWQQRLGDRFFLFVGVLRYYKGLHILLEAAKQASYPIVIVGAGPIEEELKHTIKHAGLKNVLLLGELPEEDKVALLLLCYSLVFPSHLQTEAFGLTLLEGAMFGKPLISSEIGTGTTFVNINEETGLVVPPSDPTALAKAMQLLWGNPLKAERMGKAALERYQQYFTAEKMVKAYVDLYANLLKV
jgi:rhamnosyl/mannosyltransferase